MRVVSCVAACLLMSFSGWAAAGGGSCDAPAIVPQAPLSANSCSGQHIPLLNHGTIEVPGTANVYAISGARVPGDIVSVTVEALDPALFSPAAFLCEAPCGTDGECRDAYQSDDSGVVVISIPYDNKPYYLIVSSMWDACGEYDLSVQGHFLAPAE